MFNVFNGMTNLELLIDLSSDNVTEFMAKLESSVVILKKYGLEVWSIVNTERVILTEEIDVNKLKFADSKLIESILTEK